MTNFELAPDGDQHTRGSGPGRRAPSAPAGTTTGPSSGWRDALPLRWRTKSLTNLVKVWRNALTALVTGFAAAPTVPTVPAASSRP